MALSQGVPIGRTEIPRGGSIRSIYDAAATQQAQDYDDIMGGYSDIQGRAKARSSESPYSYQSLSPIAMQSLPGYQYSRTGDLGRAIGGFQDFARTGGYSDSDIGNIRARGLSPIRAVYENARRNLDRQKSLQGGYSPNYGAVLSKMAREQSSLAADASTNINAEVAKMVQSGKLAGLQGQAPLVANENTLVNQIGQRNVDAARDTAQYNTADERDVRNTNANLKIRADEMNQQSRMGAMDDEMSALSGKTNLYGTTPALTNMFAQQVLQNNQQQMQAVQTANQIKNARAGVGLNIVGAAQQSGATKRGGVSIGR